MEELMGRRINQTAEDLPRICRAWKDRVMKEDWDTMNAIQDTIRDEPQNIGYEANTRGRLYNHMGLNWENGDLGRGGENWVEILNHMFERWEETYRYLG